MKTNSTFSLFILWGIGFHHFSCVTPETDRPFPDILGAWECIIPPVNYGSLHSNGRIVHMDFSNENSAFNLNARDTTEKYSPLLKDTILKITGKWTHNSSKDSIYLQCSTCITTDTTHIILYDKSSQDKPILLPLNIKKTDGLNKSDGIVWEISSHDLEPFLPLLGIFLKPNDINILKACNFPITFVKCGLP